MSSDDWPEWLPSDWTVQIKKIDERKVMCYIDPDGHKFYSKPQVDRHIKTLNNTRVSEKDNNEGGSAVDLSLGPDAPHTSEVPQSTPRPRGRSRKLTTGSSTNKSKETGDFLAGDAFSSGLGSSQEKNAESEWLPDGWTVEVKTRESGAKYKIYMDPVSGRKFQSKPQVLSFLSTTNSSGAKQNEGEEFSAEPDKQHEAIGAKSNDVSKKTEKFRVSTTDYEVVSSTAADRLPPGWVKEIRMKNNGRKDTFYLDPLRGYAFFSKLDALRYLESGDVKSCVMRPLRRDMNEGDIETGGTLAGDASSSGLGSSQRKNGESEWLPDGWTVEVKTKESNGSKHKVYIDPVSGRKFHSKPQVLSHLSSTNSSGAKQKEGENFSTEPDKSQKYEAPAVESDDTPKKTESVRMSTADYEVISSTPADGLPPGWVKEIRMKNNGRKDPFYLDSLSGYAFFSKLDALRYLESGDIKSCVMRPLRKDMNEGDIPNANLAGGEFASPPDLSKRTETSKVSPNNSAVESKSKEGEGGTTHKRKVRSITRDGYISITPDASRKGEISDWLPDGWVVEVNVRDNGTKYKSFKETATGRKFYSKPQVLNYIGNVNSSNSRKRKGGRPKSYSEDDYDDYSEDHVWSPSSGPSETKRQKFSIKKKGSVVDSNYTEVIMTSAAEGLPPGWIKEVRTKKYATHERKDPFYIDPVSEYIFRSKLDALRFLETGDIELCAMRPKKRDADGNEVYVFGPEGKKPVKTLYRELSEDEEENDESMLDENHDNDKKTRTRRVKRPRTAKQNKASTVLPARTSGRRKGAKQDPPSHGEDDIVGEEKQVSGLNLEKEAEEEQIAYQLEEDTNWTDHCLDFAVRTLTSEILTEPVNGRDENGGLVSETPTKVN